MSYSSSAGVAPEPGLMRRLGHGGRDPLSGSGSRLVAVLLLLAPACWGQDKSGVTPNTISLPSGPGSIEGLGASFQPQLNRYRRVGTHWEGDLPDGSRMLFGLTPEGRVADEATGRVYAWLCERHIDTHGNVIVYSYTSMPGETNRNQKYLREISYGPGAPPWDHFHFMVFTYGDRPDWFEDGRSGFLVRTGRRLKEIVVGTQGAPLDGHAGDALPFRRG